MPGGEEVEEVKDLVVYPSGKTTCTLSVTVTGSGSVVKVCVVVVVGTVLSVVFVVLISLA